MPVSVATSAVRPDVPSSTVSPRKEGEGDCVRVIVTVRDAVNEGVCDALCVSEGVNVRVADCVVVSDAVMVRDREPVAVGVPVSVGVNVTERV